MGHVLIFCDNTIKINQLFFKKKMPTYIFFCILCAPSLPNRPIYHQQANCVSKCPPPFYNGTCLSKKGKELTCPPVSAEILLVAKKSVSTTNKSNVIFERVPRPPPPSLFLISMYQPMSLLLYLVCAPSLY